MSLTKRPHERTRWMTARKRRERGDTQKKSTVQKRSEDRVERAGTKKSKKRCRKGHERRKTARVHESREQHNRRRRFLDVSLDVSKASFDAELNSLSNNTSYVTVTYHLAKL